MKTSRLLWLLPALAVLVGVCLWFNESPRPGQQTRPARVSTDSSPPTPPPSRESLSAFGNETSRRPSLPESVNFTEWSQRYLGGTEEEKAVLLVEGIRLAEAHRAAMKQMIQTDPRRAIENAVPMVVRQSLPQGITALLERRVHETADVEVQAVSEDAAPEEPRVRRFTTIGEETLRTFVYGRRLEQNSLTQVPVNGVAVDNMLALSESPLRVLEIGEEPPANAERVQQCPVSGITTQIEEAAAPVAEDTAAVQVGQQIVYLCEGGHIRVFEEELIAGEGGTGGTTGITGPAATGFNNGPRTLLYMRLAYADDLLEPQTEAAAWEGIRGLNSYFQEVSYGKVFYLAAVPPLIILPKSKAWYVQDYNTNGGSNGLIMNDAKEMARRMGYNPDNFQHYTVIYSSGPGSFGGLGSVGGSNVWLKSTSLGVFVHEIGHNVGLWHGNSWNTSSGRDVIGGGGNGEYGNSYDVLGSSGSVTGNKGHFMTPHKNQMNWLTSEVVSTARTGGLYRIFPMDQTVLDPTRRYALKVPKDVDRDYWVEFRQKYNADHRWFKDGVTLSWSPWGQNLDTSAVGSNRGGQILDTTPGSADGKNDGPVVIGRTFSDRESGIHITPVAKGGTTPESMDVMVNVGDFPANTAPVINTLSADTVTPAVNGTVNFTVDATDADGDTLAYFWDFGDATYGTNSATTAKQFTTARHHAVRCIVSDMKGGEVSKLMLITVGAPTTFTATGRVLDGGVSPLREVRIQNGSSGASFRGAWTDSNGDFIVTNLATGSVTLTPVLGGYSFTPANVAISVGPNATVPDFTAAQTVRLSIEATDADAAETGGNTSTLRLTRTGSTTAALTVYADLQGDATLTSDYTLAPAADTTTVSPIEVFTIPAGAATLDLTVTPVNDSTREGPEALRFVLIPHTNYTITGKAAADVIITDTGTNNVANRVTVVAVDENADESGDAGVFEIRRTGPTTNALNVSVALAGATGTTAATNGSDYELISSPVTIPADAASVTVTVTPTNDAAVEGQETAQLTVSTSTLYGVGTPSSAIVRLADDDIPTVSITATDATATEGGTDTGLFTLTRTGDTANALVVDYIIGGSALHGTDYLALPGTLTIPAGAASATILITPVDDAQGEPAQTVLLQLRNDPRHLLGTANSATVTIVDNDLPVVAIGVSDSSCNEPNATGGFRVTTTGTGTGNITVRYTVSGTATSGSDFTALSGTLSIAKNTTGTITITPVEDALLENAETVTLTITPDAAYSVDVLQNKATLSIRDNDVTDTVNVSFTTATMNENSGTSKLWFSRTGSTGSASTLGALTVNYAVSGTATAGTDCTALTGTAVIPDAANGVEVALTGTNDTTAEGAETLIVTLLPGSYSIERGTASLTITDDDSGLARTALFATRSTVKTEGDAAFTIPVVLSTADPVSTITIEYIVDTNSATGSGVDTNLVAGTLTFAPGETQKDIPASVVDDLLPELEEHLTLKLSYANGATLTNSGCYHTLFIRDNEPRVSIEAGDAIAYEQTADTASFVLSRSGPVTGTLVVNLAATGTATTATDYSGFTATVTFAAGERRLTRTLTAITDALVEGAETITVSLLPSTKYTVAGNGSETLTLLDSGTDHPPSVRITKPLRSEVALPNGSGILLESVVTDDGAPGSASLVWSKLSGPGTVTFGDATAAQTTARFSTAGRHVLRCTATDSATQTAFAEVTVVVSPGSTLWAGQDIGITGTNATGADDFRDGLVQNQAAGSSITGTSDTFRLSHAELSGDGEIVARFEGVDGLFGSARSGLMVRESGAANSRYAALTFSGTTSLNWNTRTTAGGTPGSTSATVTPGPRWLRVTRVGNAFAGFHSTDGTNWTQVGANTTVSMAATARAGIAMTSASSTRPARSLFTQVRVTGTPSNAAPLTDAASTATVSSAAAKQLDGTISDDAATGGSVIISWSRFSGPGTAMFADSTNPDTTVAFSAEGDQVLRLSADDGEVTSFEDVTMQVQFATLGFGTVTEAQEGGGMPGQIIVTRSGPTDMPLTLSYTTGGTAGSSDYTALPGALTIPAGAAQAAIVVTPQTDTLLEGDETVVFTLVDEAAYHLGATPAATLTLKENALDAWRMAQFGSEANNPAVSGDTVDYDHDGLENILEFALAMDPQDTTDRELPEAGVTGNVCHFIYTRPLNAPGIVYTVEWSTTLSGWSSAGVTEVQIAADATTRTMRASVTLPDGAKGFMRLRVTRQ